MLSHLNEESKQAAATTQVTAKVYISLPFIYARLVGSLTCATYVTCLSRMRLEDTLTFLADEAISLLQIGIKIVFCTECDPRMGSDFCIINVQLHHLPDSVLTGDQEPVPGSAQSEPQCAWLYLLSLYVSANQ